MAHSPVISIIMPILNREAFIRPATESILGQTAQDWELLYGDGGSTDRTKAIGLEYAGGDSRIRFIDCGRENVAKTRNMLLDACKGRYVAILDSDDIALPDRLEKQLAFLDSHPALLGCGGNFTFIDDEGAPIQSDRYPSRLTDPDAILPLLLQGWACFSHTSMMFRRPALATVGGYREHFRHAEDDDLFLRLFDHGKLANMEDVLVAYRCHGENRNRPGRSLHRAVALASAHLRRLRRYGFSDLVDARKEPFDIAFLLELFSLLGEHSVPVRLFWIGMLQHYREEDSNALIHAWLGVAALPRTAEILGMRDEILRHWTTCREKFPHEFEQILRDIRSNAFTSGTGGLLGDFLLDMRESL